MASASKKESTNKLLRSLLLAEKNGFPMERLAAEYYGLVGESLPYRAFGYKSLELYLRSIPEVVTLRRNPDGSYQSYGVADESTQHIKSLVNRQRASKKSKVKSRRPRPIPMFKSRLKPAWNARPGPVYRSPPSRPAAFPRPTLRRAPAPAWDPPMKPMTKPAPPSLISLASTYRSSSGTKVTQERTNYNSSKPSSKSSFSQPQAVSNRNGFNSKQSAYPKQAGFNNKMDHAHEHITRHIDTANVQAHRHSPSPPPTEPAPSGSGMSAFVSVVSQDAFPVSQSSANPVDKNQSGPRMPAPRILAPRFLKQMQKEIEVQRLKDVAIEDKRRQQAQQLAMEHNNNANHNCKELRITIANDTSEKEDDIINEHSNCSPAREEWPSREQIVTESDWRSPDKLIERSVRSIGAEDHRSDHTDYQTDDYEAIQSTPLPSLVPLLPSTEEEPICQWFRKELHSKNSGIWRNSLDSEFGKHFGKSLTNDVIESMANLKILTVDNVYNQQIVYPNYKIESTSNAPRKVIVNGNTSNSNGGTVSPVERLPKQPLQKTASTSSDTPASLQSPTNASPTPVGNNDPSMPDYSHLAASLPDIEVVEVYVSYIKDLQDFYLLIIHSDYADKLYAQEEDMSRYYEYSQRELQGPPAPGCMYAAELNNEWLRVMVDTLHDDHVSCFLVDHGDTERIEISNLQPLAPKFLDLPFQAIPCKLEGTEDISENTEAVLKFCELSLGIPMQGELTSREGDAQVEAILYHEDAVVTVNDHCLSCL